MPNKYDFVFNTGEVISQSSSLSGLTICEVALRHVKKDKRITAHFIDKNKYKAKLY